MWLVAHNRCWTADRLARRNLPRPERCLFCDQEEETIHHILAGCVFARQFWYVLLQRVGHATISPQLPDKNFMAWWSKAADSVSSTTRKGLNSIIILGAWVLWKHRNDCVFNGKSPNLSTALVVAGEEIRWGGDMADAKDLALLTDQVEDVGD